MMNTSIAVIRFLSETYAASNPTSVSRQLTQGQAEMLAAGMERAGFKREERLAILREIWPDTAIDSTKDLSQAQGVPLMRWLLGLGSERSSATREISQDKRSFLRAILQEAEVEEVESVN